MHQFYLQNSIRKMKHGNNHAYKIDAFIYVSDCMVHKVHVSWQYIIHIRLSSWYHQSKNISDEAGVSGAG